MGRVSESFDHRQTDIRGRVGQGNPHGRPLAGPSVEIGRVTFIAAPLSIVMSFYELTVSNASSQLGPKLRRAVGDGCLPEGACSGRIMSGWVSATVAEWPYVLERLRVALGRPIVDRTGLTGALDFDLTWVPGLGVDADPKAVDVFQAIRDQLGLKVESTRGPIEVTVVDRIERPTPN